VRAPSRSILILWAVALTLLLAGAWAGRAELPSTAGAPDSAILQAEPAGSGATPPQVEGEWRVDSLDTPLPDRLRSLGGLLLIGLLAWGLSVDRKRIPWRVVGWGLALQFGFALFILKTPMGAGLFALLNTLVVALLGFTVEGARFIFGDLVFNTVPVGTGEAGSPVMEETPGMVARTGAFFAFNVLPTIIFFSSLMSLLYHLGIMQLLVRGVAWVMQRTMGTSGAETLSAAGNIFVGQTEAPLLVKPFVARMTNSELMAVMTGGFATVAGGVLAAFVGMLVMYFPDIAGHLIAASVMSAPAALVVAKIMVPEDGEPETATGLGVDLERRYVNSIDAAAGGAAEGLHLALNVGAMLLAFIALIAMLNAGIGWVGGFAGLPDLSLEGILGAILAPLAWMMGVTWADASTVASLMGVKTVVNEFVAYLQLSALLGGEVSLEPRSVIIATYALSGFANFSSIAIQIGGIGGIAPQRRQDLSRLGLRAMVAGSLAAFMTATIAGMLL
jgi:concentrative nucleoside transporter, CNT family